MNHRLVAINSDQKHKRLKGFKKIKINDRPY